MSEKLSIEERVERQLLANLADIEGVSDTYRWDERQGNPSSGGDAMLVTDSTTASPDADSPNTNLVTQRFRVGVMIARNRNVPDKGAEAKNRMVARVKEKLLADTELIEDGTSERLALDIRYVGSPPPIVVAGKPRFWAVAQFEVTYTEDYSDPYNGPGLTERTV